MMPTTSSSLSTTTSAPTPFLAMSSRASRTLASGVIVQALWPFWSSMSLTVIMILPPVSVEIAGQVVPVEPLGQGHAGHGPGDRPVQGLVERIGDDLTRLGEGGDGLGRGDEHFPGNARHVGVHGPAKDPGETEDVVDRLAVGREGRAGRLGPLGLDLRVGIGQGQDD